MVPSGSRSLVDVGCGTGAFTMGAALRGYRALGLSWDSRNQTVAQQRAKICKADTASFEVQDVRRLDERPDLAEQFDVAICCECIEHIVDDVKLMKDMARCLKPEGVLLLTRQISASSQWRMTMKIYRVGTMGVMSVVDILRTI